jgi:hypothetical protein
MLMAMNKKTKAILVFALTMIVSYVFADAFFKLIIDTYLIPHIGMRSLVAAINAGVFFLIFIKLVDAKYHFEEKGLNLFK